MPTLPRVLYNVGLTFRFNLAMQVNIAAYKFVTFENLEEMRAQYQAISSELGLKGTIRLNDHTLMPLTAVLSKKMLPAVRNAGPGAEANLPEKIEIQFDGTADRPQPRVDSLTRMIQDAAAKAQTATTPAAH